MLGWDWYIICCEGVRIGTRFERTGKDWSKLKDTGLAQIGVEEAELRICISLIVVW